MHTDFSFRARSMRRQLTFVVALVAVITAIGVSPTVAGTTQQDYGSSVRCKYRTNSPGPAFTARLKTIVVQPPQIFAKSGHQTVGWRFVVRRTIDGGEYSFHKVTYRSPIRTARATTWRAASFDAMRVDVALPKNYEDLRNAYYQVVLRMLWYRSDGTVKSATSYLMPQYTVRVKGDGWAYTEAGYDRCDAVQWAAV